MVVAVVVAVVVASFRQNSLSHHTRGPHHPVFLGIPLATRQSPCSSSSMFAAIASIVCVSANVPPQCKHVTRRVGTALSR
eukprot:10203026-Alexandrium_andersonii.AAC.1